MSTWPNVSALANYVEYAAVIVLGPPACSAHQADNLCLKTLASFLHPQGALILQGVNEVNWIDKLKDLWVQDKLMELLNMDLESNMSMQVPPLIQHRIFWSGPTLPILTEDTWISSMYDTSCPYRLAQCSPLARERGILQKRLIGKL